MVIATIFICILFFVAGMLSLLAAIFNWDWFFNSSNAKLLTGTFSRTIARIVYAVIGIAVLGMDAVIVQSLF
jgi:uncharacterized membrane protein YuzA (DUF378 family)